jgi:hypothetical protein
MNIIKYKKNDIFDYFLKKNGKINFNRVKYNQEIGIKAVIKKYYNFEYINFPPNLIKKNNNNKFINDYNLNLLLLYSYFLKNKNLYYIDYNDNNHKYIFLKNNKDYIIKYLYIKKNIYEHKKIFKTYEYDVDNKIIKLILEYIYLYLLHNKKYISDNEIYIKLFYQYYIENIQTEIYLLYNKKYCDFANYRTLYIFLEKKGYVDTFYKKLVPIIKKYYKKILNNIDFSGIKEFERDIFSKEMKPFSKININKIIDEYYTNKKKNKIIKDKLKELTKKLNV